MSLALAPLPASAQAMGKVALDDATPASFNQPARQENAPPAPPTRPAPIVDTLKPPALIPAPIPASALAINIPSPPPAPTQPPLPPKPVAEAIPKPTFTVPATPSLPAPAPIAAEPIPEVTLPKPAATKPAAPDKKPISIEEKPIRPAATTATTTPAADAAADKKAPAATSTYTSLAQVGAALAIVIGLILIGKAAARKFLPGAKAASGKGVIEVLARHPLAKNQSIVLVRIGSQIVALNQGRESSESVLVISDATEVSRIIGQIEGKNPNSISSGFNKLLANARIDLEETGDEPDLRSMNAECLDEQLEEMAAAKRQLMELRHHVRSVRDSLPRA